MEYRKLGRRIYIRADKGEELIECITQVCGALDIASATFHGIGACGSVTTAVFQKEKNDFLLQSRRGHLEMLSLEGNIVTAEDGRYVPHAHAMFACLNKNNETSFFGGHLKEAEVSYTAELVLEPVEEGKIGQKKDPVTGINVWKF